MSKDLFAEPPIKRKVHFHKAGEKRMKKQQLEATSFREVPGEISGAGQLWQWVKQVNPKVNSRLMNVGWVDVDDVVKDGPLPEEFDLHVREGLSSSQQETSQQETFAWMEDLLSRIHDWDNAVLSSDNVIASLPWPFLPFQNVPSSSSSSSSSSSEFKLRILDLGENETLKSIWGKKSAVKILERECYIKLWETGVKPLFEEEGRVAVLVMGNPGIGKTGFLLYVLTILLKEKKKVLLRTKGGSLYYFNPDAAGGGVMVGSYIDVKLDRDPDIFFLTDGRLPDVPVFLGKALLACSPPKSNYKDYEKDAACIKFYLPVWSSSELSLLRQEVFPGRDLQATSNRYKQWGGIPRYVLKMVADDLSEIIQKLPSSTEVTAASFGVAESNHPCHKVLFMQIRDSFKGYDLQYASPFVRKSVYEKVYRDQASNLRAFIAFKRRAMQGFGALKGGILQEHFRNISVGIKRFKVFEVFEKLVSGAPAMQQFTFGQPHAVWSLEELSSPIYDTMIWPDNPVEEAIDALLLTKNSAQQAVLQLFQVTLSCGRHEHGLKYGGLLKVMDKFKVPPSRVEVYIVTTNELFADAGWQDWRIKNNNVLGDRNIKNRLRGIRQFALDTNA